MCADKKNDCLYICSYKHTADVSKWVTDTLSHMRGGRKASQGRKEAKKKEREYENVFLPFSVKIEFNWHILMQKSLPFCGPTVNSVIWRNHTFIMELAEVYWKSKKSNNKAAL